MERKTVTVTLRVLTCMYGGERPTKSDVELLRELALTEERNLDVEELARTIGRRTLNKNFNRLGRTRHKWFF